MNKTALKKFAIDARNELREKARIRALQYGISEESITKATLVTSDAVFIDGRQLTKSEQAQRNKLINQIKLKGFDQVIEEVAYTWFNRFIALRFMEVHNYLPFKIRVLSSVSGSVEPDIIHEALSLDIEGLNKDKIYDLKFKADYQATEELYRYLIIKVCNDLNKILPNMFERIEDYTELLFPTSLLAEESFLRVMTNIDIITAEDWKEVEIIGWLYQFYNSEKKDEAFSGLDRNIKLNKHTIPAATQLFTPDWIVKYLVENTLGRIWNEGNPESNLRKKWHYYLDSSEQDPLVYRELVNISDTYKNMKPEEIKIFDPCMGSGHILVYAFDILMDIYRSAGYEDKEAVKLIIENNLYGLDIDDRAAQLSYFAIMMKGRSYSRKFFSEITAHNLLSLQDTLLLENDFINELVEFVANNSSECESVKTNMLLLINTFKHAKELGSTIFIDSIDIDLIQRNIGALEKINLDLLDLNLLNMIKVYIVPLIRQAKLLSNKYEVVITNPPYMGNGNLNRNLSSYIKDKYPDSKSDLYSVFIERCQFQTKRHFFFALITQHSWMFLSSFEKLRLNMMKNNLINMVHLGTRAFEELKGEVVQTAAFVYRKSNISNYNSGFIRLVDYGSQELKIAEFNNKINYYRKKIENFNIIPNKSFAYWINETATNNFRFNSLSSVAVAVKGLDTCDNDKFVRNWYEVDVNKVGFKINACSDTYNFKWFPYSKGGGYRKWYGFNLKVVNWENDGAELRNLRNSDGKIKSRPQNTRYYFKEGLTWSTITSNKLSMRTMNKSIFGGGGSGLFTEGDIYYLLGLLNSNVADFYLKLLNPTLNYLVNDLLAIPFRINFDYVGKIRILVQDCIALSAEEWNYSETSPDFTTSPLIGKLKCSSLEETIVNYSSHYCDLISKIKENEDELNRMFIDIYELNADIETNNELNDFTVLSIDASQEIKKFISFFVGCLLGRYSLNIPGVRYAGGKYHDIESSDFEIDTDNIILINNYISNDKIFFNKLVDFVQVTFGNEFLNRNIEYIANGLGKRNDEQSEEAINRYFVNDFYKDHLQIYQKRPIYWMFTSGKYKAFNALIYMHRYDSSTISRIRTDYVHVVQKRQEAQKLSLIETIESNCESQKSKNEAKKKLDFLEKQIVELRDYEQLLHHYADLHIEIDLDDGVVHNYAIFKDLLHKI